MATRSQRQSNRTKRQAQRQESRTERTGTRQSKRAERQKTRQEQKTQRTFARQARKTVKEQAKGASGYYTPEGTTARYEGIGNIAQTGIEGVTTGVGAYMTGGASLAGGSVLDTLGGFLGGETPSTNGGGGYYAEEFDMTSVPAKKKEWFQNPVILGSLAAAGIGLIVLGTRK